MLSPPRPKMPFTYVVNVYSDMSVPKGHLGSRGKAFKNDLKDTSFIFPMTNVTILGIFCTNAQKEYGKVWEMKSIPILNILALLLFLKLAMHLLKVWSKGIQFKEVKWGMGVESAYFNGIVNGESLWNVFCCLLCIFYCWTTPILKNIRAMWKFGVCNHFN